MLISLFVGLLLAHFVGDFVLQTDSLCEQKRERNARSWFLYVHALFISLLALSALWDIRLWYVALAIGISHFLIDLIKTYVKTDDKKVGFWVFVIDQALHILILAAAAYVCVHRFGWNCPKWLTPNVQRTLAFIAAALVCWKPANMFIKSVLEHNRVSFPSEDSSSFHAGKLIGTIERWLILVFILVGCYDVIGFLIAAKSIIRFGEGKKGEEDKDRTEYFLAGTLLSIAIAVGCGLLVKVVCGVVGD